MSAAARRPGRGRLPAHLALSLSVAAGLFGPPAGAAGRARPQEGSALPPPAATQRCLPERWLRALWPPGARTAFEPTTLEERAAFARLVPALLAAAPERAGAEPPAALVELARGVGFRLEAWRHEDETLWVLREAPGRRRGAGAYLFRTGEATDDVVQAPHVPFDAGTGELAVALFACAPPGARPRALATNTAHRYLAQPEGPAALALDVADDGPEVFPADVAHNSEHLFQVVTDLLARDLPRLRLFQLHGFGRPDAPGRKGLAAVVSAGSRTPSPCARAVARRLSGLLGDGVRLFPEGTQLLGGTKNVQGRLLQAYPHARFIHLELSAPSRRALARPERVAELARALFAPEEETAP